MMKYAYLFLLVVNFAQAAADRSTVATIEASKMRFSCCEEAHLKFYCWSDIKKMGQEGKAALVDDTSLGRLYQKELLNGLLKTLMENPEVDFAGRKIASEAFSQPEIARALRRAKDAFRRNQRKPVMVGKYVGKYGRLLNKYVQQSIDEKIPGLKYRTSVAKVLEKNARFKELSEEQITHYMAIQFALGLCWSELGGGGALRCDNCRPRYYPNWPVDPETEQWQQFERARKTALLAAKGNPEAVQTGVLIKTGAAASSSSSSQTILPQSDMQKRHKTRRSAAKTTSAKTKKSIEIN